MSDDTICGADTTGTDSPCQNPAGDNGRCWIPSHQPKSETAADSDGRGRPSKYSEERAAAAIAAAETGKSKAGCARAAGVAKSTLHDWLDAGHTFEDEDFRNAFRRARAQGESELITGGLYDDETDSSMAKFLLASSFDYQKSERREVDADHTHNASEQYAQLVAAASERDAEIDE